MLGSNELSFAENGLFMRESIMGALIAVGGVIAGAIITGIFSYFGARQTKKIESYRNQLRVAYRDIAAFHRLEDRYLTALADNERTKESWKRDIRKQQFDAGFPIPSKHATAREAEDKLEQLG
jgi:hypothetical protein